MLLCFNYKEKSGKRAAVVRVMSTRFKNNNNTSGLIDSPQLFENHSKKLYQLTGKHVLLIKYACISFALRLLRWKFFGIGTELKISMHPAINEWIFLAGSLYYISLSTSNQRSTRCLFGSEWENSEEWQGCHEKAMHMGVACTAEWFSIIYPNKSSMLYDTT